MADLRIIEQGLDLLHGRAGNPSLLKGFEPFRARALAQDSLDGCRELGSVPAAFGGLIVAWIDCQFGLADHLTQATPEALGATCQKEPRIRRRKQLIGEGSARLARPQTDLRIFGIDKRP